MLDRFVRFLATGFGVGSMPSAPGLAGSIVGLGYWWLLWWSRDPLIYWGVFIAVVLLAVWVAGEAAMSMGKSDPPSVVIDEIAVMPLALAGLGGTWWHVALAFVWFRVFDVWKPPPVRQAQDFAGGVGIVLDDVLAALYACGITHATVWCVAKLQLQLR